MYWMLFYDAFGHCRLKPYPSSSDVVVCVLVNIILWSHTVTARANVKWPETRVEEVSGRDAHLPCIAAQHPHPQDQLVLVVWYKDSSRTPFYILDVREGEGRREHVEEELRDRLISECNGTLLTLSPSKGSDTGSYRCRVDFNIAPTRSSVVTLTVYVLPQRLLLLDHHSRGVDAGSVVKALVEGQSLILHCVASGGEPPPQVTWWKEDELLTNHSITVGQDGTLLASDEQDGDDNNNNNPNFNTYNPNTYNPNSPLPPMPPLLPVGVLGVMGVKYVRAVLSIPALTPEYAHANVSCKAFNNNLTPPLEASVLLQVYTKPTSVSIKPPWEPLMEGRQSRVECIAKGSYPPAHITWHNILNGHSTKLNNAKSLGMEEEEEEEGGGAVVTSSSWLTLVPEAGDHGSTLTCSAHNPHIPQHTVTTSTVLQVLFPPRVTVKRGYSEVETPVTEGEDVFFVCEVASNPPPHSIVWHKDGVKVLQDQRTGVLVSGNNLVLQMVRRTWVGNYTCTASNTLSTTTSNVLPLNIKYLPVCLDVAQTVVVGEGEDVRLNCRVDAKPDHDLRFTWFFNNTLDTVEVERHRVEVHDGYSYLDYTPRSSRDYGSLACWATNTVGTQADPCQFTVLEAGPPDSVEDCELIPQQDNSGRLEVKCVPGYNGGVTQWFVASVLDAATHTLITTLQHNQPVFQINGLRAGQDYLITITAVNNRGTSNPQHIDAIRLKVAEKRMVEVSEPVLSPLVGMLVGLIGGLFALILLAVSITFMRSYRCRRLINSEGTGTSRGKSSLTTKPLPNTSTQHNTTQPYTNNTTDNHTQPYTNNTTDNHTQPYTNNTDKHTQPYTNTNNTQAYTNNSQEYSFKHSPDYSHQALEYKHSPEYSKHSPEYSKHSPDYSHQAPEYNKHSPEYSHQEYSFKHSPEYNHQAPEYSQQAPEYSKHSTEYNHQAPEYSQQAPEYKHSPDYSQQAPEYNKHSPEYSKQNGPDVLLSTSISNSQRIGNNVCKIKDL